ncbi:5-formyltetrahydrofolate cyclo-ligase [Thiomicrospira microaerophila]|uniref:5-formyltetrahydrofolate cyclo-ligase n=1 Tax=Thiomicrospira microaerophila TaxID=406020 RepID=UPI00201013D3|nr:5-formyltetrahydrofolate cyclo-ligase [Thiomicrospira microaerophila]UQB43177.1 5-formyltetrahydrofolate cyclo-ligase [Thiomicrospira microaerophila]
MTGLDRLRQSLRQQRRDLSLAEQKYNAQQAVIHLINSGLIQPQSSVAAFLAQDGELDTSILIEQLWQQACRVYLPVIDFETKTMRFAAYRPDSLLKKNRFGINEPDMTQAEGLNAVSDLDGVFMPLVGFDAKGHRLGMGGGFYDRTLSFKLKQPKTKPWLIGWAHQCQQLESLNSQPWDVPLDAIVTEQGCTRF